MKFEEATPRPEYLIKSIAEQGYSLETAIADLIDNSISAKATGVEILIDMKSQPFTLFLADNGNGMSESTLVKSMHFPSASPDSSRETSDLGRFGLGMKTASFSQTRKFTVISRSNHIDKFNARTWDVEYLKKAGKWNLLVNSEDEIEEILSHYKKVSEDHLNSIEDFQAKTIIAWQGLYKFEEHLSSNKRKSYISRQIEEITREHLSLVFHRFLDSTKYPLCIRLNNIQIKGFNPFPVGNKTLRSVEPKQKEFKNENVKLEGFVLPSSAIDEVKNGSTKWTTKHRSLTDMEGLYVYRANRLIIFGGWNGLIRKGPRLQLARLRLDMGNKIDCYFHLNVAKSQISVPSDLRDAFKDYIDDLQTEAEREFYNRGIRKFSETKSKVKPSLFLRVASNKGTLLQLNLDFPLISSLTESFNKEQKEKLNLIFRMINTRVNEIRQTHEDKPYTSLTEDGIEDHNIIELINTFLSSGFEKKHILNDLLPSLGISKSSLPDEINEMLK